MLHRLEVGVFDHIDDTQGRKTAVRIHESLGLKASGVRQVKVFTLSGFTDSQVQTLLQRCALHDPVLQQASLSPIPCTADWIIEVGFRPGVTDNEGRTARDTAALVLGIKDHAEREKLAVYTSVQYRITGPGLTLDDIKRIAGGLLANELIQRYEIRSGRELASHPFEAKAAKVTGEANDDIRVIPLSAMDDDALMQLSREHTLALNLTEMRVIRSHFTDPAVRAEREKLNLPADPLDAELEMLAQTWSEHCKHKIFAATVHYEDKDAGLKEEVNSLYKTCIMEPTKKIRASRGKDDFCRSVFTDNAGVIAFSDGYDACIKVETHNSPSALDPYGGALTGIVGVNRDPLGTGMGAELICNTDVFCFASPFHDDKLPPRLLHPRRVLEGVREGVEHGGNKSGVPTVNGSLVFDERYLGKPLVYCGTVGLLPREVPGIGGKGAPRPGYAKKARPGDAIVMIGGRIGADGIHGATFSSEELHEGSPATAVQIGDPITQRKVVDFVIRARDLGLYSSITDNGAGGLASSVGEMAEDTNGCEMDLSLAPLKYDGLRPWEILLSEAQERMTLAVPQEQLEDFLSLASHMDVEATVLGRYTDSGFFHVTCRGKIVTHLDMDFLHKGLPRMELKAVWQAPQRADSRVDIPAEEQGALLKKMLGRLNICSKEYIVRQYDHEVQGGSAVKPMTGVRADAPSDAGVLRPVLTCEAGLVLSHGICPKFSDYDTYWMTANAIDEGIRNAVASGANPDHMAGVDNFCWCDPVESEKTPDGAYKMAQLVRACKALSDFCQAYGVPCISGKDSMKNDYSGGGKKISIPPTLLFSVMGVIEDVRHAVTSDFKTPGDRIYILGTTRRELGGSELASQLGVSCARVPQVDAKAASASYRLLHKAMTQDLVSACHDLSDGGLAVALAEMCIGGRLGAEIDLAKLPAAEGETLSDTEKLYSESASRLLITVPEKHAAAFEALFEGCPAPLACLGAVTKEPKLAIGGVCSENVEDLAKAFKATLNW
ncbi:MAG: phosphoribosylformylglycinamidine synthase [Desulfovibrionaceae bacterium]|nr:phosphoribosylformylglycinamidine synthase [Desulfovibrionaceae bacterium]